MPESDPKETRRAELLGDIMDAWEEGEAGLNRLLDQRTPADDDVLELLPFTHVVRTAAGADQLESEQAERIADWVERTWQLNRALKVKRRRRFLGFAIPALAALAVLIAILSTVILSSASFADPPYPDAVSASREQDRQHAKMLMSDSDLPEGDHRLRDLREQRYQAYMKDYNWIQRYNR